MILRSDADMSGLPLPADPYALAHVRYTDAIILDHFTILAPLFVDHDGSYFSYVAAFSWPVWLLIVFSLMSVALVDITLSRLHHWLHSPKRSNKVGQRFDISIRRAFSSRTPRSTNRQRGMSMPTIHQIQLPSRVITKRSRKLMKMSYKYWMYHRVLFNQSVPTLPDRPHSRILIFIWWFAVLVINSCFSGSLLATLLKEKPARQINTLSDLFSHKSLQPVTVSGGPFKLSYDYEDFNSGSNQLFEYNDKILFTSSDNITSPDTIDKVVSGHYALITNRLSIEAIVARRGSCHFNIGTEQLLQTSLGLAFSRTTINPTFFRRVNHRLRDLYRTGMLNKWMRDASYVDLVSGLRQKFFVQRFSCRTLTTKRVLLSKNVEEVVHSLGRTFTASSFYSCSAFRVQWSSC